MKKSIINYKSIESVVLNYYIIVLQGEIFFKRKSVLSVEKCIKITWEDGRIIEVITTNLITGKV